MLCPTCNAEGRKFGKDKHGHQRFQCLPCKKTFSDRPVTPLGSMRLDPEKALKCLQLLLEGMSVRATMRVTGVNRATILNLLVQVGDQCELGYGQELLPGFAGLRFCPVIPLGKVVIEQDTRLGRRRIPTPPTRRVDLIQQAHRHS